MFIGGHLGLSLGALVGWRRFAGRPLHFRLIPLAFFALLPDLVDKPVGLIWTELGTKRLAAHSLLFSLLFVLAARRLLPRLRLYAWLVPLHLFLDTMWNQPHTLLFPLLGLRFDSDIMFPDFASWLDMAVWRLLHTPETLAAEAAGLLVMALYLWGRPERGRLFGDAKAFRSKAPPG
jgi:hypothetical protein